MKFNQVFDKINQMLNFKNITLNFDLNVFVLIKIFNLPSKV